MLKRQGVIEAWQDRRIGAGEELHAQISKHDENDDIILLLVSPDFLASEYCYDQEMLRAMERHGTGEAIVIPVILRPSEGWTGAPFGKLSRQRTAPWIAGMGPLSTTSTRAWRCVSFSRERGPGALPSSNPSGPRALNRITQSRTI